MTDYQLSRKAMADVRSIADHILWPRIDLSGTNLKVGPSKRLVFWEHGGEAIARWGFDGQEMRCTLQP